MCLLGVFTFQNDLLALFASLAQVSQCSYTCLDAETFVSYSSPCTLRTNERQLRRRYWEIARDSFLVAMKVTLIEIDLLICSCPRIVGLFSLERWLQAVYASFVKSEIPSTNISCESDVRISNPAVPHVTIAFSPGIPTPIVLLFLWHTFISVALKMNKNHGFGAKLSQFPNSLRCFSRTNSNSGLLKSSSFRSYLRATSWIASIV